MNTYSSAFLEPDIQEKSRSMFDKGRELAMSKGQELLAKTGVIPSAYYNTPTEGSFEPIGEGEKKEGVSKAKLTIGVLVGMFLAKFLKDKFSKVIKDIGDDIGTNIIDGIGGEKKTKKTKKAKKKKSSKKAKKSPKKKKSTKKKAKKK